MVRYNLYSSIHDGSDVHGPAIPSVAHPGALLSSRMRNMAMCKVGVGE
jgi:hypothetical protein